MDEIDKQTQLAFDVASPPPVEEWAEPTERKDTFLETAYKFSAPGFREAYERAMKAGTREGTAGAFPEPNSRLESAYQSALGYFADMGLAGMQAADAAFQFAIGATTELVPGQDSDEEMRLSRDLYGMTEAAMGNPAGAARAVDDVVESAGRMGQQVPAFMAAEEGAVKVPRFKEKASGATPESVQRLPDAVIGTLNLGDIFFDRAGGNLSDGTPLNYAPNITLHDVANVILGRKTPEEVLEYYGNDPEPELVDYLNYRIEGLKDYKDFQDYVEKYSQLNSPYDPWDHVGLFESKTEQPSGITVFRSAIPEVIDQITFPEQGIKGSQLLKEIQDSPSIRMSEWRSLGVDIDPQKRYSKEEVNEFVSNNLWEVKAVPESRWGGYQRQKDLQDEEKDYFEFAIDATRQGPTFKAKGQHFGEGTLAHVRASVREGQQGDYILVEELQSDLLQHGFESPRKARPFSDIVEEFKREVESFRNDLEDIIQDDFDNEDLGTISTAKIDPNDLKKNNYARYAKVLEIIPAEELQKSLPNGSDLSTSQGLLLKYSEKLPEEINANDIRVVLGNLGKKQYRNKSVSEPPIAKTEEGVRFAFDALIDKAVKEGIDKIVIPPFERIVERRFDVDTESYENALKPTSGFYATYIKSVNKVLKEYEQEFGKDNFSYRLESLNYPSNSSDPLFKPEKMENLDFELSLALGDFDKTSFDSWRSYLDKGFLTDYITYNASPSGEIYFPETGRDTTFRSVDGFLPDLQRMSEKAVNEKTLPSGLSTDEFETVLDQVSGDGLGLARVENALFREGLLPLSEFKVPNDAPDLPKEGLVIDISKLKNTPYDFSKPKFNQGGLAKKGVDNQMRQIFAEGGITDDGMKRDPVSGNEVPPGSLTEEVRDDIDAKLSTGEYVVPADVVRYFGVAYFEKLRKKAKEGFGEMEADGRIGGEPSEEEEDDFPFGDEELEYEETTLEMAEGGLAAAPPFNPSQYSYGADPLGAMASGGMGGGVETRTYINAAGDRMSVLFVNGQPLTDIPSGFVPDTEEGRKQLPVQARGEEAPKAEPERGGRTDEERRLARGEKEAEAGISPENNLFNMSEEQLLEWTKGGVSEMGGRIAQGAGMLMGGPMGLLAGAGVKAYNQLEPLQRTRTAAMVAEERGLTALAEELNARAATLEAELKPGARAMANMFATGNMEFNSHLKAWNNYAPEQRTSSAPSATGAGGSPASPAGRSPVGGSGRAAEQERLSFGSAYEGGSGRAAEQARTPSTVREAANRDLSMGREGPERTDRTASAAGAAGDFGRGAGLDLSMGEPVERTARDRAREAAERTGSGMATQGRATGGLVDKPQKHKTEKKSRRKIKTVEK